MTDHILLQIMPIFMLLVWWVSFWWKSWVILIQWSSLLVSGRY